MGKSDKGREKHEEEKRKKHQNKKNFQNNMKDNGNKGKKSNKPLPLEKKKSGYSCCGIINSVLFITLIITASTCLFIALDGDYSVNGVQKAIPKLVEDGKYVFNVTITSIKSQELSKSFESARIGVQKAWIEYMPWEVMYAVRKNFYYGIEALEGYTGDLSPYSDLVYKRTNELYELLAKLVKISYGHISDFFKDIDINSVKNATHRFSTFTVEQAYVLKEELYRNKAFVATWEPCRDYIIYCTEFVKDSTYHIAKEAQESWFPLLKEKVLLGFNYAKNSAQSLFS